MAERKVDLAKLHLNLRLGISFANATDHGERLRTLESVLDIIYAQLTDERHVMQKQGEDEISYAILGRLRMVGIPATHDTQIGGHIDLLVESDDGFRWIGEAKLDNGAGYVLGGYDQLTTRYAAARTGQNTGEILIYCKKARPDLRIAAWRDRLRETYPEVEISEDSCNAPDLRFRSVNICQVTGGRFHVRHRIVPLYFDPKK